MMKLRLFLILSLVQLSLKAENKIISDSKPIKADTMNGYKLKDFRDFEKNWKLVTVRFRRDTGEMRFTYANALAFESLLKGTADYPNGAIFAKIGFKTAEDAGFPSSAVPNNTRRYQFMVREKKQFKGTDGWGYVLFDNEGSIFAEKPEIQEAACAACHRIVPERGFVFSEYLEFSPFKKKSKETKSSPHYTEKISFTDTKLSDLPEFLRSHLPADTKEVRILKHEITEFLFQGTLDEVKPILTTEAVRTQKPTLFLSKDKKSYAIVFVENLNIRCEVEGRAGYFMKAVSNSPQQKGQAYENRYCWPD